MVIIQVDHEFENWDALLGLHSWSEFLLAPTTEEADKSSKVFFCTYSTGKALSDAGRSLLLLMEVVLLIFIIPRQDGTA